MSEASDHIDEGVSMPPPKEHPERLVLRGKPRPVVRFRRGLLVGMTGAAAASLIALCWSALEPRSFHHAAASMEDGDLGANGAADALADAPSNYGEVPRLGPPLPGDLGRPILEHERSLGEPSTAEADDRLNRHSAADEERQRIAAARETARSSPLLAQLSPGSSAWLAAADLDHENATAPSSSSPGGPVIGERPSAPSAETDIDRHQPSGTPSSSTLSAGTIVPASLITGLNSDLPGIVIAQVTQNVRDSATGRTILVPQGARLIGAYDSSTSYGQRRALLVWTRIVFPDGSSVGLDKMPASDAAGYSGLQDRVDTHSWQLLKGIAFSTLLGIGTELSLGSSESDLVRAVRQSAQQNAADAGQQLTARNLDVRPTIMVRPGWPVRAILSKDLVLQPWSEPLKD
ncbi:MAG: TrbI/VirB10 family protein [Sphingomonas sp.]